MLDLVINPGDYHICHFCIELVLDFPRDSCPILATMVAMRAGGGAQLLPGAKRPGDQSGGEPQAGALERRVHEGRTGGLEVR